MKITEVIIASKESKDTGSSATISSAIKGDQTQDIVPQDIVSENFQGTIEEQPDHSAIAEGVAFTRELVSEPANIVYPESFVERARAKMEPLGVTIRVLDEPEMEKLGMHALLGVSVDIINH